MLCVASATKVSKHGRAGCRVNKCISPRSNGQDSRHCLAAAKSLNPPQCQRHAHFRWTENRALRASVQSSSQRLGVSKVVAGERRVAWWQVAGRRTKQQFSCVTVASWNRGPWPVGQRAHLSSTFPNRKEVAPLESCDWLGHPGARTA